MLQPRKKKRKSAWDHDPAKSAAADAVLRNSRAFLRHPDRLLRLLAEGGTVSLPGRSDLAVIAALFEAVHRGEHAACPLRVDVDVLGRLLLFCRGETDLLACQQAARYGDALLALAAHHRDWVRPLESWRADTHNVYRQFHSLVRHLIARYDVPIFMNSAWLEGLTASGLIHQGWFIHVARGANIRTAAGLPIPLTSKQAHHFLHAPDDFDIPSAFRWAGIVDLGGDERLVRSILATRIGLAFGDESFWTSVFRFFIAHPMLDPAHHGPIVDYLLRQKFEASAPNPLADRPGQPPLLPPQPQLSMRGRTPKSLLLAIGRWHRSLARTPVSAPASWPESGFPPFVLEGGTGDDARRLEVVELLGSEELAEEGRAMHHCVASYAGSCASGRTSIWSLRKRLESGRAVRLVTIEVANVPRRIVQVRRRRNALPSEGELAILKGWGEAGGPALSYWMAR